MAKYLVTGGCGFIGSNLVKALSENGDEARILDTQQTLPDGVDPGRIEFIQASTLDKPAMAQAFEGIDACFHLAGISIGHDPRRDERDANTQITGYAKTLFDSAHAAGNIPVIYASSAAVYGPQPSGPIPETALTNPVNAHGEEKLLMEKEASEAFKNYEIPSVGFRFFNVYGPGQSPLSIYCGAPRKFIELIKTGKEIPLYGGGRQVRDFTHIDDVVQSMLQILKINLDQAHLINIGTGVGVTIRGVAEILGELAGRELDFKDLPIGSTDVKESVADASKAKQVFNYRTVISLEKGLQEMVEKLI